MTTPKKGIFKLNSVVAEVHRIWEMNESLSPPHPFSASPFLLPPFDI